jgi:adenosylcobinamide kinase/adenosylcobinamide-phosphate guanylyltransferase
VTYVATAPDRPDDAEWTERITLHRARRPAAWRTAATGDLAGTLRAAGAAEILLVDDIGNWLTRIADDIGAWEDRGTVPALRAAVADLVDAWAGTSARVVAVSNEVGSGVVPVSFSGRLFRDEVGRLNTLLAAASERVVLVVAGLPMWLRGRDGT